jgi:hypothetical protein
MPTTSDNPVFSLVDDNESPYTHHLPMDLAGDCIFDLASSVRCRQLYNVATSSTKNSSKKPSAQ